MHAPLRACSLQLLLGIVPPCLDAGSACPHRLAVIFDARSSNASVYTTTDMGTTWKAQAPNRPCAWGSFAMTANGARLYGACGSHLLASINGGAFAPLTACDGCASGTPEVQGVEVSGDGRVIAAHCPCNALSNALSQWFDSEPDYLVLSDTYGESIMHPVVPSFKATWAGSYGMSMHRPPVWRSPAGPWQQTAVSADGSTLLLLTQSALLRLRRMAGRWVADGQAMLPSSFECNATFACPRMLACSGSASAVLIAGRGPLRLTRDGMKTWQEVPRLAGAMEVAVAEDGRTLRALQASSASSLVLHSSTDSGRTWSSARVPTEPNMAVNVGVPMLRVYGSSGVLIATSGARGLLYSQDGGRTYAALRPPAGAPPSNRPYRMFMSLGESECRWAAASWRSCTRFHFHACIV